ncbi:MAG TPA: DUF3881 family protein [Pyrinomonadaceae bacterium]|jgi:hypothetical protein
MEIVFDAIGIEIANETAFNDLAETIGSRGEVSRLTRKSGILHGRCLKLGEGLEVWSVLYESESGEVSFANYRPGFRAKFSQKITPWILTEIDTEGEAVVHGFIADTETEVLFELQNLTEVGPEIFDQNVLSVGLCGLAYRAEVLKTAEKGFWRSYDEIVLNVVASENDWSLCGRILAFNSLRNHLSGNDLYWIYLDLGEFKIEVLVNQRALKGGNLCVGAYFKTDVWLQGHIVNGNSARNSYEGIDRRHRTADFWKNFKRLN